MLAKRSTRRVVSHRCPFSTYPAIARAIACSPVSVATAQLHCSNHVPSLSLMIAFVRLHCWFASNFRAEAFHVAQIPVSAVSNPMNALALTLNTAPHSSGASVIDVLRSRVYNSIVTFPLVDCDDEDEGCLPTPVGASAVCVPARRTTTSDSTRSSSNGLVAAAYWNTKASPLP